ncbi:MAG: hypothetical protein ACTHLP_00645 [Rhizobiaceae bacterium]|jgi:hypothetical protein
MTHITGCSRRKGALLVGAAAFAATLLATVFAANADNFPGGRQDRDWVTGYLCVGTCSTVRLPNADCICQKVNPGETDVRKLKLKCYGMEHGRWTSCPVKPRYGISVN